MSLTFGIEPLAKCWNECMALAVMHWQETEEYRHGQVFCPSFERYQEYDKLGMLVVYTARDGQRLAGHCGMYFCYSMHTQQLIATEDALFMHPDYRRGRNAIRFIQFIEADCRARGVVEIGITAKTSNTVGKLLQYLDFVPVSVQYSKSLARADSASVQHAVEGQSDVQRIRSRSSTFS